MSDPAVEAAEKAGVGVSSICHLVAVGAVRAALGPIRALCEEWDSKGALHPQVCEILDQLAPLVFATEELGDD